MRSPSAALRGEEEHTIGCVHCRPANPDILRPERDIFWTGSGHFFERTFFELDPDLFWAFFSPDTDMFWTRSRFFWTGSQLTFA